MLERTADHVANLLVDELPPPAFWEDFITRTFGAGDKAKADGGGHDVSGWRTHWLANQLNISVADSESRRVRAREIDNAKAMGTVEKRPPPLFRHGQSALQYWASWMAKAKESPATIQGKHRPKWYSGEIIAYLKWDTVTYAGVEFTGHTYRVSAGMGPGWNGMLEVIPECYLMERHRPRINMYFGGGANALVRVQCIL